MRERKRILLVEDNPNDVELILAALAAHDLASDVAVASDGAEALDYLSHPQETPLEARASGLPAVVFLDIKMPRMDGIEVLRRMKADPDLRSIPVVMLTSSCEQQDLEASYEIGVNAYVVKPVDFQCFMDSVRHLGRFWADMNEPPPGTMPRRL